MKLKPITKARREWFGGIVYSEHPGLTAFVDRRYADYLKLPPLAEFAEGVFSAPLDVHLELTTRCNLNCDFCYNRKTELLQRDMNLSLAKSIIDKLHELSIFTIALGGGEPFLNDNLFDIAYYARSKDIVPNITTNGILIDEEMARQCQVFGNVHLSCHLFEELDRLGNSVEILQKNGVSPGLNLLVSNKTFDYLPDIFKWCSRKKISQILILKFKTTMNNKNFDHLCMSPEQETELIPLVRKLSLKYRVMLMLDCSLFPLLALHKFKKKALKFFDINGCQGANAYMAVTVDGFYKPCSFWQEHCGKVELLDKNQWLKNDLLVKFRKLTRTPICNKCSYYYLCNGGCRVCEQQSCFPAKLERK